jgi:hypothetical protein
VKKFPSQITLLCLLAGISTANAASAADSVRVNGVPVYGNLRAVTRADIREAIVDESTNKTIPSDPKKPRALEVVGGTEMHAYLPEREMGWIPVRRITRVALNGREHPAWSYGWWGIHDAPDQLRFIRTAKDVYIFPIPAGSKAAHRDNKHLRLLPVGVQHELVPLLGHEQDWFGGSYGGSFSIGPEPRDVAFVFKRGDHELVLFFSAGRFAKGTFNGAHTGGLLDEKAGEQFDQWKRRFAQQELPSKTR